MSRDQLLGLMIFVFFVVSIIVYGWFVFVSEYAIIVLKLTCFVIVASIFSILAWIGYTLAKTPPSRPVEDIEKEIENELKRLDMEVTEKGAMCVEGSGEKTC